MAQGGVGMRPWMFEVLMAAAVAGLVVFAQNILLPLSVGSSASEVWNSLPLWWRGVWLAFSLVPLGAALAVGIVGYLIRASGVTGRVFSTFVTAFTASLFSSLNSEFVEIQTLASGVAPTTVFAYSLVGAMAVTFLGSVVALALHLIAPRIARRQSPQLDVADGADRGSYPTG